MKIHYMTRKAIYTEEERKRRHNEYVADTFLYPLQEKKRTDASMYKKIQHTEEFLSFQEAEHQRILIINKLIKQANKLQQEKMLLTKQIAEKKKELTEFKQSFKKTVRYVTNRERQKRIDMMKQIKKKNKEKKLK